MRTDLFPVANVREGSSPLDLAVRLVSMFACRLIKDICRSQSRRLRATRLRQGVRAQFRL